MAWDAQRFGHLYPFQSHWLDLDGLRYHYVDEGRGDALVCVHGNPSWSFLFRDLIRELRATQRVIAPDHIGCGLSDKPPDAAYEYTLERRVGDLERLIDHLKLERVTLVLHDWGGVIGLAWAVRHIERLSRLILFNTAGYLKPAGKGLPLALYFVRHMPGVPALLVRGLNAFARVAARACTVGLMPADVRAAFCAPYDSWATRIATLRFVQDIPLRPTDRSYPLVRSIDDHLSELCSRPTLICWGMRDFVFDDAYLAEWRRRVPQAEFHAFDEAGHYLLEDAGPEVLARVREFLARNEATRPEAAEEPR